MNKFDRQSRDAADKQPLPQAAARDLSRITTEVIELSDAPPIAPRAPLSQSEVRTILISLMLTMFLAALDQTIVATALPTIGRQFHDVTTLSWVITAYLLASTAVAPVFGTLSDIYGRRAMIIGLPAVSLLIRISSIAVFPLLRSEYVARKNCGRRVRRHCEEHLRRSNPVLGATGLLRGACHRARIGATRWLAMTVRSFSAALPRA
jgi:MFS family permease